MCSTQLWVVLISALMTNKILFWSCVLDFGLSERGPKQLPYVFCFPLSMTAVVLTPGTCGSTLILTLITTWHKCLRVCCSVRRPSNRLKVWRIWNFRSWKEKSITQKTWRVTIRSCWGRSQSISISRSHARYSTGFYHTDRNICRCVSPGLQQYSRWIISKLAQVQLFKVLFLASLVSGKPQVTCRNRVKINGPAVVFHADIEPHQPTWLRGFAPASGGLWRVHVVHVLLLSPQERLAALKKQSSQIALQAQQERENFQREKNNLLVMLQKVGTVAACCCCCCCKLCIVFTPLWCLQEREKLASLDGKYAELSVGQSFSNSRVAITEVGPSRKRSGPISVTLMWPSAISVTSAAFEPTEGTKKKRQRKLLPCQWESTSQEEPAAPRLLWQISRAHASN